MKPTNLNVGIKAEYDTAKTIVMHNPGDELYFGCLQNSAALFENEPFDRFEAMREHQEYVDTLRGLGIDILLLKDVLLDGTIDGAGKKKQGKDLDQLTALAANSLTYSYPIELSLEQLTEMKEYKAKTLESMHPLDLFKTIMLKPWVVLRINDEASSKIIANSYSLQPVMNLHFLRDQQITTDLGIVIGRMSPSQRRVETEITRFAFQKLGLNIAYQVEKEGRLEGGDFIPCRNYAFMGQGLRTNSEGIKQLLENQALQYPEVAIVKDSYRQQDEMHLDTYFNIAGPNKAVILEDRVDHYNAKGELVRAVPEKSSVVDVYVLEEEGYVRKKENVPFQEYLTTKGFEVGRAGQDNSLITLTKEEQLNYGVNFLTIAENKVVAVRDVSPSYLRKMSGIDVVEVNLKTFVKTYGAPHCATQVIYRANEPNQRDETQNITGGVK